MYNETVLVMVSRLCHIFFIICRYDGGINLAVILICVVLFVLGWGYGVVSVSWCCALFVLIFWYSNANIPCTLFPCSKFSHRVFIWQGFLTRQGFWMIDVFEVSSFPRSGVDAFYFMAAASSLKSAAVIAYFDSGLIIFEELCWISVFCLFVSPGLSSVSLLSMGCLCMVMVGTPLVGPFGDLHVFRVHM